MTTSFLDSFVGEQQVEGVPVGGAFTPTGLIGQVSAPAESLCVKN